MKKILGEKKYVHKKAHNLENVRIKVKQLITNSASFVFHSECTIST